MTDIVERLEGWRDVGPSLAIVSDALEAAEEIKRLRAALEEIAKTTYGRELSDTDAEIAEHYTRIVARFQNAARAALGEKT